MPFFVANLIVLALATTLFWWLSGFDSRLSGNNDLHDKTRRGLRAVVSVIIVEFIFLYFWRYEHERNSNAGFAYLGAGLCLSIVWCDCLSHLGAQLFRSLIDS